MATAARMRTTPSPEDHALRDLVESAGIGVHFVGPTGIILWANAADFEPLGYSADEYIGRHISEFHADSDAIADILSRLTRGERLANHAARLRCKDGSTRRVVINSSARFAADGTFLHTRCFTVDLTERAELEAKLLLTNDRLRLALEAGGMGTWEWDMTTGVVTWSGTLEAIHGIPAGSFAGTLEAYQATIHPDDVSMVLGAVQGIVHSELGEGHFEHRINRPDRETRWVECHGKLLRDEHARPMRVIGVSRDITDRKHAELLAAQQTDELRAVGAFRERFLGIAAHDLRGPLNTIVTGSHVMLTSEDLPERLARTVARVARASERMGRMITDLFDFTRGRLAGGLPITAADVEMGDLAERVLDELRLAEPVRDIELTRRGDLHGRWDADRVAQVLTNLVTNALRHGEGRVAVHLHDEAGHVILAVHNHGASIPEHEMATLFDPFRRGSERSEGLGLGLYIVSEIVRAHGGTVGVTSSADRGTRFEVRWPRHATG